MKYKSKQQSSEELDQFLRQFIAAGNAYLPPERELSEQLNISRFTLRRLLLERENSGAIIKKPKGRAVALPAKPGTILYLARGKMTIDNPVWNTLYMALTEECRQRNLGLELMLCESSEPDETAVRRIAGSEAGFIVETFHEPVLEQYRGMFPGKKILYTDQRCRDAAEYMVSQDNFLTGRTAARCFSESGCHSPLMLGYLFQVNGHADEQHAYQEKGFAAECRECGMRFDPAQDILETFAISGSSDALIHFIDRLEKLLERRLNRYDCCFATNTSAARLLDSLIRLKHPEAAANFPLITSSGNGPCTNSVRSISTLTARLGEQAAAIAEIGLAVLTGQKCREKKVFFGPEYVEGDTFRLPAKYRLHYNRSRVE